MIENATFKKKKKKKNVKYAKNVDIKLPLSILSLSSHLSCILSIDIKFIPLSLFLLSPLLYSSYCYQIHSPPLVSPPTSFVFFLLISNSLSPFLYSSYWYQIHSPPLVSPPTSFIFFLLISNSLPSPCFSSYLFYILPIDIKFTPLNLFLLPPLFASPPTSIIFFLLISNSLPSTCFSSHIFYILPIDIKFTPLKVFLLPPLYVEMISTLLHWQLRDKLKDMFIGVTSEIFYSNCSCYLVNKIAARCPWCNCYRRRKWTRRHEFKSWMRRIAFHIALIPLGKVWIQLFSL